MANAFGSGLAVRLARALYRQWEALAPDDRSALEPLASNVKERALELRGKVDDGQAERELEELRAELKRELERVAREQGEQRAA